MMSPVLENLRGKFIVFDGNEGCGKSTQASLLRETLTSYDLDVLLVRDPGSTRIGEQIRQILLNPENTDMAMRCEMLLYMAARAQMMKQIIQPGIDQGQVVICDRFISSTLAYQLGGDNLTAREIRSVGEIAIGGKWPDLTIILDLPIEVSSARVRPKFSLFPNDPDAGVEKDRIERRSMAYHEQVRQNYLRQARGPHGKFRVINANREPQEVQQDVWKTIEELAKDK
ncbi:MAG TPA: dTMP kinase [Tepidisphaeraceae bacterium]|nr:dTMP kinase [Tepidisphaeraceae bacterium]